MQGLARIDGAWRTTASRTPHLDALAHITTTTARSTTATSRTPAEVQKANRHFKNSIHNLEERHLHPRRADRYSRLKGVPAWAGHADLRRGSRGLGEAGRRQGRPRRCCLFVRTGVWARRKAVGPYARGRNAKDAGLDPSVIPWLRQRDVAIMGSDHPRVRVAIGDHGRHARFLAAVSRDPPARQLRSRSPRRRRGRARSDGISC